MALISLVYVSYASRDMTTDDLMDILNTARDNNRKQNITGMLLYRDRFFIQALEGEEAEVMPLFERIKGDPRHKNVLVVYTNDIKERSFGDWGMGFNHVTNEDLENVDGFSEYLETGFDENLFVNNPMRARVLLESFRERTFY